MDRDKGATDCCLIWIKIIGSQFFNPSFEPIFPSNPTTGYSHKSITFSFSWSSWKVFRNNSWFVSNIDSYCVQGLYIIYKPWLCVHFYQPSLYFKMDKTSSTLSMNKNNVLSNSIFQSFTFHIKILSFHEWLSWDPHIFSRYEKNIIIEKRFFGI